MSDTAITDGCRQALGYLCTVKFDSYRPHETRRHQLTRFTTRLLRLKGFQIWQVHNASSQSNRKSDLITLMSILHVKMQEQARLVQMLCDDRRIRCAPLLVVTARSGATRQSCVLRGIASLMLAMTGAIRHCRQLPW